jgi:hypothetical protein
VLPLRAPIRGGFCHVSRRPQRARFPERDLLTPVTMRGCVFLAVAAFLSACGSAADGVVLGGGGDAGMAGPGPQDASTVPGRDAAGPSGERDSATADRAEMADAMSEGAADATPEDAAADAGNEDPPGTWRSALFPRGWLPLDEGGSADSQGRFLHDFSYAAYHRGEVSPPYGVGAATVTVDASLGNGTTDATAAIQGAINTVCSSGGGVVQIPAGTFVLKLPTATAGQALLVNCSHLVLRGAGPAQTRLLFDDAARARQKAVIVFAASSPSIYGPTTGNAFAEDVLLPTRSVTLTSASGLSVGDSVVLRNDVTAAFRAEHRMDNAHTGQGDFWPTSSFPGLVYPRTITAISGNQIQIDVPTRYALKTRDAARVYPLPAFIQESGIESLAIGMVQSQATGSGTTEVATDNDYTVAGTMGYAVHESRALFFDRIHDAWIYDVDTFLPDANKASGYEILSIGIWLTTSVFRTTIENCDFGRPQYRGNGGNGYSFLIQGHENLIVHDTATTGRHGLIVSEPASGNVFLHDTATNSRYANDAHRFLANANLYDGIDLDGDFLQAVNRGTESGGAGFTATSHVFWNVHVLHDSPAAAGCAVETAEFDWGYAIGSRAEAGQTAKLCPMSFTNSAWAMLDQGAPTDFVEGEGMGATLFPSSLYDEQRSLRCARQGVSCSP